MKKSVAIASGLAIAVVVVGVVGSFEDAAKPDKPTVAASAEDTTSRPDTADNERADLDYLKMDDRSNEWITDIWLRWQITNNSSEQSDYSFEWEAIDTTTGKRVDDGYNFENNVLPGQTVQGDTFTELDKARNIKINITDFERTKSW